MNPFGVARPSVVEQGLDHGGDLVANLGVDGAEPVPEPVLVDRPDQLTLDVAGVVEDVVGICADLDVDRQTTPTCSQRDQDSWGLVVTRRRLPPSSRAWSGNVIRFAT